MKKCDWCEEDFAELNEVHNPHAWLCNDCNNAFYDSTSPRDYCDLECVMCGQCTQVC